MSTVDVVSRGKELVHYGVKGMRWGVRTRGLNTGKIYFEKDDGTKRTTRTGRITTAKPKRKAPTSEDFKKAQSAKSKVKKGKTHALTNDELQALVKRMNLEKQYKQLSSEQKTAGKKVVQGLLKGTSGVAGNIAKQQISRVGNDIVSKQIDEMLKKKK